MLARIMAGMPDAHFQFLWFNQLGLPPPASIPNNCTIVGEYRILQGPVFEFIARALQSLVRRGRRLGRLFDGLLQLGQVACVGVRLGRELRRRGGDRLWFVLQGDRPMVCYTIAQTMAGRPYVLHQWDPVSWWMGHRTLPRAYQTWIKGLLRRFEARAFLNVVPSAVWQAKLITEGKTAVRADNFIEARLLKGRRLLALREPGVLHAVFLGEFYASAELVAIVGRLIEHSVACGKRLVVHYFGSGQAPQIVGCRFVAHGFIDRDALIESVSKWELALLPYPVEARFEETARLSFPSKVRVYMAAGLPILSNAPDFSGVHAFLAREYAEFYCNMRLAGDFDAFMGRIDLCGYAEASKRFDAASQLVLREFSDEAELVPLKRLIEDGI